MANVTDAELAIIQKALRAVTDALQGDDSPAAQEIKKQCLEADQIVSAKLGQGDMSPVGGSSVTNAVREILALTIIQ